MPPYEYAALPTRIAFIGSMPFVALLTMIATGEVVLSPLVGHYFSLKFFFVPLILWLLTSYVADGVNKAGRYHRLPQTVWLADNLFELSLRMIFISLAIGIAYLMLDITIHLLA